MQNDCSSCSACCLELLASQCNKPISAPLIFHYHSPVPTEVVGAYTHCLWVKAGWHRGYVGSLLQSHIERHKIIQTFIPTNGLFGALIHLMCMSLDCGLKFENLERTHVDMRTCKLHTEALQDRGLNLLPSFWGMTALTTSPSVQHKCVFTRQFGLYWNLFQRPPVF